MKVKVCGITKLEDALLCEELGTDAIGFIFYQKSKRFLEPELAGLISKVLSPFTLKVGVFVNHSVDQINKISKIAKINIAQIHSMNEYEDKTRISLPHYNVYRINNSFDFNSIPNEDYCLLDSFSKSEFGGTGIKFNWELIPKHLLNKTILAGGIDEDALPVLINKIKPYGVDLSSSLEDENGNKSKVKIKSFFTKLNHLRSYKC